jgi:hypothetical protein
MKLARLIKMCLNETYSRVRVSKLLSDTFPIKNGLKRGDALPPLPFNFGLEYGIRRVQTNQGGLELNGTHQRLVYADIFNILGGCIHTTRKNTEALEFASEETGLEVNSETTEYMIMSQDQNAGQNHNVLIDNKSFERVKHLKYFGRTISYQNSINEEIKSRLKSGKAFYLSVQNRLLPVCYPKL